MLQIKSPVLFNHSTFCFQKGIIVKFKEIISVSLSNLINFTRRTYSIFLQGFILLKPENMKKKHPQI